jgi:hypothetical protein
MEIPVQPTDATEPWTLEMCQLEEPQLMSKTSALLGENGVTLTSLEVDVANGGVTVGYTYNGNDDSPTIPTWHNTGHLTPWPANYLANRILGNLGLN